MRIRFFLALASVSFVTMGFAIQACGGSSSDTGGTPEAGVAETSADTGATDSSLPDAKDAAPPCDPKKDFLADIPDASIADGASTTGVCVGCIKTNCKMEVAACAADCTCQNLAGKALECYAKTQDAFGCAGQFAAVPTATRNIGIALFGCVNNQCDDECATSSFQDAGDGG
jgi:hypothetical protein